MIFKLILTLLVVGFLGIVIFHHKHQANQLQDNVVADKRLIKYAFEKANMAVELDKKRSMEAYVHVVSALQTLNDLITRHEGVSNVKKYTGYDIQEMIDTFEKYRDKIWLTINEEYHGAIRKSQLTSFKVLIESDSEDDSDEEQEDE